MSPWTVRLFAITHLTLTGIASFNGIVLVIVFFVTSSDSGSLVINRSPTVVGSTRRWRSAFPGDRSLAGRGLAAPQAAAASTGLPFAIALLLGCYALVRGLMSEPRGKASEAA